jgi:hypothetical protein
MLTEAGGRIDRLLQMVEQGLMSVDDPALKERLDTAKVARVAASERVRMLDRPNEAGTSQITPDKINKLSVVLREALKSGDIGFRKAYLRLFLDRVVVADDEIRLRGPTIALAKAAAAGGLPATAGLVPSFVQEWRPIGDSNPCYRRERAVSWASRRMGQRPEPRLLGHENRSCNPPEPAVAQRFSETRPATRPCASTNTTRSAPPPCSSTASLSPTALMPAMCVPAGSSSTPATPANAAPGATGPAMRCMIVAATTPSPTTISTPITTVKATNARIRIPLSAARSTRPSRPAAIRC